MPAYPGVSTPLFLQPLLVSLMLLLFFFLLEASGKRFLFGISLAIVELTLLSPRAL